MAGITKRNGTWHLRMRVPRRYVGVEARMEIHRSLRTDSEREARARLPAAEAAVLAELDSRLTMGQSQQLWDARRCCVCGEQTAPVN